MTSEKVAHTSIHTSTLQSFYINKLKKQHSPCNAWTGLNHSIVGDLCPIGQFTRVFGTASGVLKNIAHGQTHTANTKRVLSCFLRYTSQKLNRHYIALVFLSYPIRGTPLPFIYCARSTTLRLQMLAGTNFSEISEEPQIR